MSTSTDNPIEVKREEVQFVLDQLQEKQAEREQASIDKIGEPKDFDEAKEMLQEARDDSSNLLDQLDVALDALTTLSDLDGEPGQIARKALVDIGEEVQD